MVLTLTGSLSVVEAGREDVRTMLAGALGCNLAWGLIDAVFYLMGCIGEKGRRLAAFRAVRETGDAERARRLISEALPPVVASVLRPAELEEVRLRLRELPAPAGPARLESADLRGALAVFVLVFLSTFPVAIPFVLMGNPVRALRVSNAIAVTLLFGAGWAFGRLSGRHPAWVGAAMVVLGGALVALAMAFGG